jgi:hypothetical protein
LGVVDGIVTGGMYDDAGVDGRVVRGGKYVFSGLCEKFLS